MSFGPSEPARAEKRPASVQEDVKASIVLKGRMSISLFPDDLSKVSRRQPAAPAEAATGGIFSGSTPPKLLASA